MEDGGCSLWSLFLSLSANVAMVVVIEGDFQISVGSCLLGIAQWHGPDAAVAWAEVLLQDVWRLAGRLSLCSSQLDTRQKQFPLPSLLRGRGAALALVVFSGN